MDMRTPLGRVRGFGSAKSGTEDFIRQRLTAIANIPLTIGAILIVNADLPCVVPDDLRALLAATPAGGIALVEALDGTTNAISLPAPDAFAPLYGLDSATRFRAHAESLGLEAVSAAVPNLANDVDTLEDLQRLHLRLGPRSQAYLASLTELVP